jgi:hypothetical protein
MWGKRGDKSQSVVDRLNDAVSAEERQRFLEHEGSAPSESQPRRRRTDAEDARAAAPAAVHSSTTGTIESRLRVLEETVAQLAREFSRRSATGAATWQATQSLAQLTPAGPSDAAARSRSVLDPEGWSKA